MDAIPGLSGVYGPGQVHERRGGNGGHKDAEAFRRAMQEHSDGAPRQRDEAGGERALRRPLQPRRPAVRRDDGEAIHIDVVA